MFIIPYISPPLSHHGFHSSTETLGSMISQLLPDSLDYLQETSTKLRGPCHSSQPQSRVYGVAETQCFLRLLSAVLERNSPKADASVYGGTTASRCSGLSSRASESRMSHVGSALQSSYSAASVHDTCSLPRVDSYQVRLAVLSIMPTKTVLCVVIV